MPRNVSQAGLPSHQLLPVSVAAPGAFGLNLQATQAVQSPQFCIEALNCVIDQYGRVAARGGRTTISTGNAASGQVRAIFEYINSAGTSTPIVAFDGGISSSLTAPNGSSLVGTISSVASGRWYFQNFNDKCIGFQSGQKPIVLASPAGTFSNIVESSGSAPQGGVGCAAYGRVWGVAADGHTLQWCALQDETNWGSGDSGSIDLRSVWPKGMDTVTAVAPFAGMLVVFGTRQILMYGGTDATVLGLDVTQIRIVDAIEGIGCISQWTVAAIGGEKERSDLLFCSLLGIQSLQRLVLDTGSHPIAQLTKNVRDTLVQQLSIETANNVSGFYSPTNGFYALSLPTSAYTWIADQRHKFADQDSDLIARITRWPIAPTAMVEFNSRIVYFASPAVGNVQKYTPGTDDGSTFSVTLQLPWLHLGEDFAGRLKVLKRVNALVNSLSQTTVLLSWYIDFNSTPTGFSNIVIGGVNSQWGVSQWGIDQWGGGSTLQKISANASGTGQYFSLSIAASVDSTFAVQQAGLLAKIGRLA